MLLFEVTELCTSFSLTVSCLSSGEALFVLINGGDIPHIGSVSLAWHDQTGCSMVSGASVPDHLDSEISDMLAKALSSHTGRNVAVACGIHINRATPAMIDEVRQASQVLIERCTTNLSCKKPTNAS